MMAVIAVRMRIFLSIAAPLLRRALQKARTTMGEKAEVRVRRAGEQDAEVFLSLVSGLVEFEGYDPLDETVRQRLLIDAFGERPRFTVLLAEVGGQAVGYALIFETYSTFLAYPKLYLEDLFVRPEYRGRGVGLALFAACSREATARGCVRMEWVVLDWNTPAREFYRRFGASHLKEWHTYQLEILNAGKPGIGARSTD
jgi:GNAT superfamily N-acetyltransferase